jgi:hypothetical protein
MTDIMQIQIGGSRMIASLQALPEITVFPENG